MKIAVAGGTGLTGRFTVSALRSAGHEVVAIARSAGVDVLTGAGLDAALDGVDAVIDVLSTPAADVAGAEEFFGTTSANLLAAERRAGVAHHVALSIVVIDRAPPESGHYAGKRRQEAVVKAGGVPFSIVRATQYYEFAEMVAGWTRADDTVYVSPVLLQPVAARDTGDVLAEVAAGAPVGTIELAGPDVHDFVDLTRRVLTAHGDSTRIIPSWHRGSMGLEYAGDILLPGPHARIGPMSFERWLTG
jgi:uncharacterized protein YbjT (DUF2867 family)